MKNFQDFQTFKKKVLHKKDCFWTVTLVEPLSTRISWLLVNYTDIHPNTITLLRIIVLFPLSTFFFLFLDPKMYALGALFYYLAFLTDNIDGHIARATGKKSNVGAILDEASDKTYIIPIIAMYVSFYNKIFLLTVIGVLMLYLRWLRKMIDLVYTKKFHTNHNTKKEKYPTTEYNPFLKIDEKLQPLLQRINPRIEGVFVRFHFAQLAILLFTPLIYFLLPQPGYIFLIIALLLFALGQISLDIAHIKKLLINLNKVKDNDRHHTSSRRG